jgi:hypothetical protein
MVISTLFLTQMAGGVYAGLEREPPTMFSVLTPMLFGFSLIAWFSSYCRAHRVALVMDMALFVLMAWFVVVPYYVVRREGRRGLHRIGLFLLTYLAAWAAGWAVSIWTRFLTETSG